MQILTRYWMFFWKIVRISQRSGGGTLKTKCWFCLFLHAAQNSAPSCEYCCLFHLVACCNLYLLLFSLRQAWVPMCVVHSSTVKNMWSSGVGFLVACQNAGLHIVTTVCDMGANNVKALKLLCATRWKPFFKFPNQDFVTVCDPPHLKCTRNCSTDTMCSFSLSLCASIFLQLLCGNIF
jgi:hypothetical protein